MATKQKLTTLGIELGSTRMQDYEFWFVVGSQFLYGPEVLETVAARASEMADVLNASGNLPCKLVYNGCNSSNASTVSIPFSLLSSG